MLINLICVLSMMLLFWFIGRIMVKFICGEEKYEFLYFVLGSSIVAFISTFLYFRIKISVPSISIFWIAVFFICILYTFFSHTKVTKHELGTLFITVLLFALLIIPGIINGEQYYVYRGNVWDQNIYISEAFTSYKYSWNDVMNSERNFPNDVYKFGYDILTSDRPSVAIVCALLFRTGVGNIYWIVYLYHCMFIAMIFCPLYALVKKVAFSVNRGGRETVQNGKSIIALSFIIAFTYIAGFWGQIQFDINAWSQICSIAIFISYIYMVFLLFEDAYSHKSEKEYICNKNIVIFIYIIMLGGIMYYVENWIIHYILSCMSILFMCFVMRFKPKVNHFFVFLSIPAVSLVFAFISCPQIVSFLLNQIVGAVGGTIDYGAYWRDWLSGFWTIEGIAQSAKIPANILSAFGMPHYVPFWGKGNAIVYIWMAFMSIVFALLIFNIIYRLYKIFTSDLKCIFERFIAVLFICIIIVGIFFYIKSREYGFVKYIMYVSPYTWILTCISIIYGVDRKKLINIKNYIWLSSLSVILAGCVFFAFRCYDTLNNEHANGYSNFVYPADQDPQLKNTHVFNYDVKKLGNSNSIELEAEFPFYLYYLKVSTLYEGKTYYCEQNHVLYSNEDEEMTIPQTIDMKVFLKQDVNGRRQPTYE